MQVSEDQLNRLRIAIALLPWPPGVRSSKDAVKRLQDLFPLKDGKEEEHWRKQATDLRTQLAGMQQASDLLRIQVISLTQQMATEGGRETTQGEKRPAELEPTDVPSKKKKKKNPSPPSSTSSEESERQVSKLEAILTMPRPLSTARSSGSHEVLSILRGIQAIVSSKDPDLELLQRSLECGLERIATVMCELLKFHCAETTSTAVPIGIPPPTSHVALISTLSGLVITLLGHFTAFFPDDTQSFAHLLIEKPLLTITRSMLPLTRGFLARSLVSTEDTNSLVDIRPALLDFITHSLTIDDVTIKDAVCKHIALESVKELEAIFSSTHASDSAPSLRRRYRQERLARKDTVPHLCSILRGALSSHGEAIMGSDSPRSLYLASTTFDKLSSLQFSLFEHQAPDDSDALSRHSELGVMGEDALLSVIEFAWMCCPLGNVAEDQVDEVEMEMDEVQDIKLQEGWQDTQIQDFVQALDETQGSWWDTVMG
ncbi:hypothetical protein CALCODRAFT_496738 [Calocera cornea HHB12733]|uniref:Uncharacterized protein n=1 Tax=Calocera cornea HHB12733 TaxID=1353952 RepID=A0A165FLK7_9BASI|nr:hypothetical protein CALCODRAFT_496738 [Calocera cornea HHB12733]